MSEIVLSGLTNFVRTTPGYRTLVKGLRAHRASQDRPTPLRVAALETARPVLAAALLRDLKAPILLLTAHPDRAHQLAQHVRAFVRQESDVLRFPAPDALPYERIPWDLETRRQRLDTLTTLTRLWKPVEASANAAAPSVAPQASAYLGAAENGESPWPIVVTSVRGLLTRTLTPAELDKSLVHLRQGRQMDLPRLLERLSAIGYEMVAVVEGPGTISHRGGIVDIYPTTSASPLRIEFFGDEIESLRRFDPATQRSAETLEEAIIAPAAEALAGRGLAVADRLNLDLSNLHPLAQAQFAREIEGLQSGVPVRDIEFYLPYLHPMPATLLDYLPPNAWILLDDWQEIATVGPEVGAQAETLRDGQVRAGELPMHWDANPVVAWGDVQGSLLARSAVALEDVPTARGERGGILEPAPRPAGAAEGDAEPTQSETGRAIGEMFVASPRYGGQLGEAVQQVLDWVDNGQAIVLVSRQADRLADLFKGWGVHLKPLAELTGIPGPRSLTLIRGVLGEGWRVSEPAAPPTDARGHLAAALHTLPPRRGEGDDGDDGGSDGQVKLTLLTDGELFGWRLPRRRRARQRQASPPESFFSDLRPGDYVVHIEHGIGRFVGMVKLEVAGTEREYLEVEYSRGDRLYVPTYQVDRVSRYVGVGDASPEVSRLGGTDWEKVKERAKRAVEELARELLDLYAARESVSGHAFGPDTPWQAELEASFPHTETEDQMRVIEEVKADMERPKPMDRLIAGDVGYGKTEVALRAAFKAVMDGKQVAILVPTTILAQQHYNTFMQRLAAFPVTVACLSRLQSDREQREIVEKLGEGKLDIVIGTHRLLSPDVRFKDLGLVIIDEEQRFGVQHKERLKQMRQEVDVLTLTATPIPRTLHMSLTGVRDLSTIDTPPEERLPIVTQAAEADDNIVRQAILREMDRGGQVYFVHNRVQGIHLVAQHLQRLVPEAIIAVAHGQMDEGELARVMLEFAGGRVDVLVCTSIIESGLDIPNANTLIVNRADRFGLAQLYQLRGRVGRSTQRAYAYFLYDKTMELSDEARRRLEAILEVSSEMGGGFRLAMRDLEIRGAGDLLGSRQHGHIAAVGFDLYTRLLAQAITELKADGDPAAQTIRPSAKLGTLTPAPTIELPLDALLPENYVPEENLRLRLYRRMSQLDNLSAVDGIAHELEDRFGPPPAPVQNLLYLLRVKIMAQRAGVHTIQREGESLILRTDRIPRAAQQALQRRLEPVGRVASNQVRIPMRSDWQPLLLETLGALAQTADEMAEAVRKANAAAKDADGPSRRRRRRPGKVAQGEPAASPGED
ncbi:MAG: transcription-repair coupling factor [Anaerolineae bacterium]